MKKKLTIGIIILLSGFLLGGISFYILGRVTGPSRPSFSALPRVPSQIIETSKAFSEIANAISPAVVNISTTKVIKRDAAPSFFEDPFFNFFDPFHEFRSRKKLAEPYLKRAQAVLQAITEVIAPETQVCRLYRSVAS
ncbi:MAG: hypothetical protein AAB151_07500, partial [Nitrospirota bacterium]